MPGQTHIHFHQAAKADDKLTAVKKVTSLLTSSIQTNSVTVSSFFTKVTVGPMWVAGGSTEVNPITIATSPDGMTWMSANNSLLTSVYGIALGVSSLVTVGSSGNAMVPMSVSSQGDDWYATNNSYVLQFGAGVAYGNKQWVAVGSPIYGSNNTSSIATSFNASNWSPTLNSPLANGSGVIYGGNRWVAVGESNTTNENTSTIGISFNGSNWFSASSSALGTAYGVAFGANKWVAVGLSNTWVSEDTSTIVVSTDGSNWNSVNNSPLSCGNGVAFGQANGSNLWVAVGAATMGSENTSSIAISKNGLDWNSSVNDPFMGGYAKGVAFGQPNGSNLWVAVGTAQGSSTIATSVDGSNWTNSFNDPFPGGSANCITFISSYTINVPSNNGVTFSKDLSLKFVDNHLAVVSGEKHLIFRDSVIDFLNKY